MIGMWMNKYIHIFSLVYQKRSTILILLFLLSLVAGSLFLLLLRGVGPQEHSIPGTDYLDVYKHNTEYFLQEGHLAIGNGKEDGSIVPPGYPLFLVPSFVIASWLNADEVSVIVFFNMFVASLSVVLLFLIAERIFNRGVALVASLLWASYPIGLWFLKNPHTEIPFIFFFLAAILVFLVGLKENKMWAAFAVGVLLGVATLIRPIALLLPFVFAFIVLFGSWGVYWRRKILFAGVVLIVYFMMLAPWAIYVVSKTQEFIPLGNYDTGSIEAGLTYAIRGHTLPIAVPDGVRSIMEEIQSSNFTTKGEFVGYSIEKLRSDPLPFSQLLFLKAVRSWYGTAQGWNQELQLLGLQLFYLIPAGAGALYAMREYKGRRSPLLFIVLLIGFFWFMTFSVLSIMRYMVPVMGFVMMFAAVFWMRIIFWAWGTMQGQRNIPVARP